MKHLWYLVFAALILAFLNGCTEKPKEKSWPYPIKDSRFSASGGNPIYWLDERRVLFIGHEGGKPRSHEEAQALKWGIFIWDVEADTIDKYAVPAEGMCYHDGFIKYFTRDPDGSRVLMKGDMGKESRYPATFYADMDRTKFVLNKHSCRLSERPDSMQGRGWVPLLEKHGYLDLGPSRRPSPPPEWEKYIYYPTDGSIPIELPVDRGAVWVIQHIDYSDSYLFARSFVYYRDEKKMICNEIWEFDPDGELSSQCLPYDEQLGTGGMPFKTAVGTVVLSRSLDRFGGTGKSGVYLYRGGRYQRLISGITSKHGLSPSGCRIAFHHKLTSMHGNIKWPGQTTLMMIDLCSKEDNKQ